MLGSFFWHSEISILNPQSKYFYKTVNMKFSKMTIFWGCEVGNWLWEKTTIWICPISWIRVKIKFFMKIGHIGRSIQKNENFRFSPKNDNFLDNTKMYRWEMPRNPPETKNVHAHSKLPLAVKVLFLVFIFGIWDQSISWSINRVNNFRWIDRLIEKIK